MLAEPGLRPDAVMLDVLHELSKRWHKVFAPDKVAGILVLWRDSCAEIPPRYWLQTAKEITRTWPDGPPPSNTRFAAECAKMAARENPEEHGQAPHVPLPVISRPSQDRVGRVIRRFCQELGYRRGMRVWEQLLHAHRDQRAAFEAGHVPETLIAATIAAEMDKKPAVELPEPEKASSFREWRHSKAIPRVKEVR